MVSLDMRYLNSTPPFQNYPVPGVKLFARGPRIFNEGQRLGDPEASNYQKLTVNCRYFKVAVPWRLEFLQNQPPRYEQPSLLARLLACSLLIRLSQRDQNNEHVIILHDWQGLIAKQKRPLFSRFRIRAKGRGREREKSLLHYVPYKCAAAFMSQA